MSEHYILDIIDDLLTVRGQKTALNIEDIEKNSIKNKSDKMMQLKKGKIEDS